MLHWLEGGALPPIDDSPPVLPPVSPPVRNQLQVPTHSVSALSLYPQGFPMPLQWPSDQMQNTHITAAAGVDAPVVPPSGGFQAMGEVQHEYDDFAITTYPSDQGTGVAVIDPPNFNDVDSILDSFKMQLDQHPQGIPDAPSKPLGKPGYDYKSIKAQNPSIFMRKQVQPLQAKVKSMVSPIDTDCTKRKSPDIAEAPQKIYEAVLADAQPGWKRSKWASSARSGALPPAGIKLGAPELKTVGGVLMQKTRQIHSESDKLQKEHDKERRKMNQMEIRSNGSAPRGPLTVHKEWIALRQFQASRILCLFARDHRDCKHGILTDTMVRVAEKLVAKAALEAHGEGRKHTASPSFWACALALEAYNRVNPGGYVVGEERAVKLLDLKELEEIVAENARTVTMMKEEHPDEIKDMLRTLKGQDLVARSIAYHSFGDSRQMIDKMNHLHNLLNAGGDVGLHADIRRLLPPTFAKFTKLVTAASTVRDKHIGSWGKKKGQKKCPPSDDFSANSTLLISDSGQATAKCPCLAFWPPRRWPPASAA